jgi:hypothetical protein
MFTWWAPWRNMKERNIGWRLDYVLASEPIFTKVQGCVIQREFGTSDHGPVVATFEGFEVLEKRASAEGRKTVMPERPGLLFSGGENGPETGVGCNEANA